MNKDIEDLEEYLGVKRGFFSELQLDDDWSFIIKLNSLFEAAVSSMITEELMRKELIGPFSAMQMGTINNGKLAFVKELDLIPESYIKYIETLAWVRNRFAHNVSSTSHDLKSYLGAISSKRRKECARYLNRAKSVESKGVEITGTAFFNDNPKMAIYLSGQIILEYIRQRTIAGQQASKAKLERIKKSGKIHIKAYEHVLDKKR